MVIYLARDGVAKFLGMYLLNRFVPDWQAAQPGDIDRKTNR